ncbi:MAG: DUF58 domain-containing protein, partial [Pseudomonadales bacterium]|nr:DUF58 domain-containing protein [Pseudomonadales bacterium]
ILLCASNSQNNLIYLLFFLLLSLLNTAILFTYQNMSGLHLRSAKAEPVFCGDMAQFTVLLKRHHKAHLRISLSCLGCPATVIDQSVNTEKRVPVYCKTQQRGRFNPGRLLLQSYYPLGFIRCWSWLDLDMQCVVYPKPIALKQLPQTDVVGDGELNSRELGSDDFDGFKTYQPGDALNQIDWRAFAKTDVLQSKVYTAVKDQSYWVDWYALPGVDTELKLSYLCDWVLQLDRQHKAYGLRLPQSEISPALGEAHKHKVLSALALFNLKGGVDV